MRSKGENEEQGLIYSRINNPNLEILENRLCLWDRSDDCAVFESGMSAISTVLMEFLKPGDLLVYSSPVYGGTDHFINHLLPRIGVVSVGIRADHNKKDIIEMIEATGKADKLAMIYLETPANPTNAVMDISMYREIGDMYKTEEKEVILAVDNTYMGPIWCHPMEHGAHLVIYSATKYIGGHSDLIAGAVLGKQEHMNRVKILRTFIGNMASPNTCWLLTRSLETLKIRMDQQMQNAKAIANKFKNHDLITKVHYLDILEANSRSYDIYKRQYSSPGAMISIEVKGGEAEAFKFLNALKLFKLAVSLGGTESIAQHPCSMTHAGVDPIAKIQIGITENLVRLSIGIENEADFILDIEQALESVKNMSVTV